MFLRFYYVGKKNVLPLNLYLLTEGILKITRLLEETKVSEITEKQVYKAHLQC